MRRLNAERAEHAEKSLSFLLRGLRGLCVERDLFTRFWGKRDAHAGNIFTRGAPTPARVAPRAGPHRPAPLRDLQSSTCAPAALRRAADPRSRTPARRSAGPRAARARAADARTGRRSALSRVPAAP